MAANRFDEAAAIYREILQKMPDEPGIMMNLGMALAMSGQPKEAIQPLSRALELRPTLMPAALFLGQSHLDLGQPEQAIAPLQKFVTAQPTNLQARQMLASASLMAGRHQQAAAEFRKVTQQAPADAKGWYGLVQSYDALSQETLDALSKTADAPLYEPLLMADALESEGKLEQAFAFYKQSLQGLPKLRATHEALARIYTKTGHAEWAAQQTAKARQLAPACAEGAARLPAAHGRQGCEREERAVQARERHEARRSEECRVRVSREAVSERDRRGREARGCRVAVLEDARVRGAGVWRAGEADRDEAVAGAARAAGRVVSESAASSAIGHGTESGVDVRAERSAAAARAGEVVSTTRAIGTPPASCSRN